MNKACDQIGNLFSIDYMNDDQRASTEVNNHHKVYFKQAAETTIRETQADSSGQLRRCWS